MSIQERVSSDDVIDSSLTLTSVMGPRATWYIRKHVASYVKTIAIVGLFDIINLHHFLMIIIFSTDRGCLRDNVNEFMIHIRTYMCISELFVTYQNN